jgi:hypothetical protein
VVPVAVCGRLPLHLLYRRRSGGHGRGEPWEGHSLYQRRTMGASRQTGALYHAVCSSALGGGTACGRQKLALYRGIGDAGTAASSIVGPDLT